jgi:hypothetical protein
MKKVGVAELFIAQRDFAKIRRQLEQSAGYFYAHERGNGEIPWQK